MARPDPRKLKKEATKALDKGKYKKALECYLELERHEPGEGSWSRRAADMHRRLGQKDEYLQALQRAADRYAKVGFLVQAVAVCKMILHADPEHTAALDRLAELNAARGIPSPKAPPPGQLPPGAMRAPGPIAVDADDGELEPTAAPARPLPVPEQRTIPPGAPLSSVDLAGAVPDSQPQPKSDGTESGITLIPIELSLDDAEIVSEDRDPSAISEEDRREQRRRSARALHATPLLSGLGPRSLQSLIERVELVELQAGQQLFREGDAGGELYVVSRGEVAVMSEGPPRVQLSRLGEGAFFGEIALVTEQGRSATIEAVEPTQLLAINRDVVGELVEEEPHVLKVLLGFLRDRLVDRLVNTSPLFGPFAGEERQSLASRFHLLECEQDSVLIEQGDHSDGLYVLLSGQAEVVREEDGQRHRLATLGSGDLCGEMSLLTHEPAVATVRLTSKALVLRLPEAAFREIIMTHPQVLMFVGDLAEERKRKLGAIASGRADYAEGHLDLF